MVSGVQQLTLLGLILRRPIAPFIFKMLHHDSVPLSRDELQARIDAKFRQFQCALPARSRIDADLDWLLGEGLVVVAEGMISLTSDGLAAAAELFGRV